MDLAPLKEKRPVSEILYAQQLKLMHYFLCYGNEQEWYMEAGVSVILRTTGFPLACSYDFTSSCIADFGKQMSSKFHFHVAIPSTMISTWYDNSSVLINSVYSTYMVFSIWRSWYSAYTVSVHLPLFGCCLWFHVSLPTSKTTGNSYHSYLSSEILNRVLFTTCYKYHFMLLLLMHRLWYI